MKISMCTRTTKTFSRDARNFPPEKVAEAFQVYAKIQELLGETACLVEVIKVSFGDNLGIRLTAVLAEPETRAKFEVSNREYGYSAYPLSWGIVPVEEMAEDFVACIRKGMEYQIQQAEENIKALRALLPTKSSSDVM